MSGSGLATPSANEKTAFDYFRGKGLTAIQSAGIVGNLQQVFTGMGTPVACATIST